MNLKDKTVLVTGGTGSFGKRFTKHVLNNYLLMHAMGPNVAGVIGSAIAAGVLISLVG